MRAFDRMTILPALAFRQPLQMSSINSAVQIELLKNPGADLTWITHSKRLIERHLCQDAFELLKAAMLIHGNNPWIAILHEVTQCICSDDPASKKAGFIQRKREAIEREEPDLMRFLTFITSDDWWPHDPSTKVSLASKKSISSAERDFLKSLEGSGNLDPETDEEAVILALCEERERAELLQEIVMVENHFDHGFYTESYASRVSETFRSTPKLLCCHYLVFGEKIGLMPCRDFAPFRYLDANEDVRSAGISAFWHWCAAGKQEGRPKNKTIGGQDLTSSEQVYAQLKNFSLENRKKAWSYNEGSIAECLSIEYDSTVKSQVNDSCNSLEVIVTFDNFTANAGGVQQCIRDAITDSLTKGILTITLFPACPYPVLRTVSPLLRVAIGESLLEGCFSICTVTEWIHSEIASRFRGFPSVSIHSLLGWHIDDLLHLYKTFKADDRSNLTIWLHDHFLFCPSYAAQRNDLEQCSLSSIDSLECHICGYREEREKAVRQIKKLFACTIPLFISPSQFMANRSYALLSEHYGITEPTIIVKEHRTITRISVNRVKKQKGSLNIAFLGAPTRMKGWDQYEMLAADLGDFTQVAFFCFSLSPPETWLPIKWVETGSGDKLIQNMRSVGIHDVILMSRAPETFGLTAYEALQAGSFIHTHRGSGNIADLVSKYSCGFVHNSYKNLLETVRSRALEDAIDMYLADIATQRS